MSNYINSLHTAGLEKTDTSKGNKFKIPKDMFQKLTRISISNEK